MGDRCVLAQQKVRVTTRLLVLGSAIFVVRNQITVKTAHTDSLAHIYICYT